MNLLPANHFQVLASAEDSSDEEAQSGFDINPLPKSYKIPAVLSNKATSEEALNQASAETKVQCRRGDIEYM